MRKNFVQKGFTLIELLIVIAVIAILATILITNVAGARQKANDTKVLADLETVQKAIAQCAALEGTPNIPAVADFVSGGVATTPVTCTGVTSITNTWPAIGNTTTPLGPKGVGGTNWGISAVTGYDIPTGLYGFVATGGSTTITCDQNGCKKSW